MINQSKLERQYKSLYKWRDAGGKGTLNLVMRFGKTMIGLLATYKMIESKKKADVIVVTPSVAVKEEWLKQIKSVREDGIFAECPLEDYIRVLTANQLLDDNIHSECELLIIDEVHKFTSDKRLSILRGDVVKYKYLMCLTGSMPGGDMGKKITTIAPIVDTITEEEALRNNWISQFIEFNIALEFPDADKSEYIIHTAAIKNYLNKFKEMYKLFRLPDRKLIYDSDFDLIMACYSGKNVHYTENGISKAYYLSPQLVREGIMNKVSWNEQLAQEWTDEYIKDCAYKFNKAMTKRNELLIKNIVKQEAVLTIFKNNPVPTICFNESTDFADIIADTINSNVNRIAICYHSNIQTAPIIDPSTGDWIRYGPRSVNAGKIKKFGKDSLRKLAIEGMIDGTYKFLSTARALDEGLTIPNLEQVITTAGTANPMQYSQRSARGKTVDIYNPGKVTKIYNLYFDDFYILNADGERELIKSRDKTKLYLRQEANRYGVIEILLSDLVE